MAHLIREVEIPKTVLEKGRLHGGGRDRTPFGGGGTSGGEGAAGRRETFDEILRRLLEDHLLVDTYFGSERGGRELGATVPGEKVDEEKTEERRFPTILHGGQRRQCGPSREKGMKRITPWQILTWRRKSNPVKESLRLRGRT